MTDSTLNPTPRWWQERFRGEEEVGYRWMHQTQTRGSRPALVLVDIVRSFVGEPGRSLEEAVAEWPPACGPAAFAALPYVAQLLTAARRARAGAGIPIVHLRPRAEDALFFGDTVKGELVDFVNSRPGAVEFLPESQPQEGELVLPKPKASGFFDTPLGTYLRRIGADSVIIAGTTTSGCVRATVVDSFSWGFPTFIVEEATFDRSALSAAVSLYEMNAKYADVITSEDALGWLGSLS
jgi:maleamate amidohydrolase